MDRLTKIQRNLYEQDFSLWLNTTVEQLKKNNFSQVDWENLIIELDGMNKSLKTALRNNLRIILMQLLKYKYQPNKRSNSWRFTIIEHRQKINDDLEDSPSLKPYLREIWTKSYQDARKLAATETGLLLNIFPSECPFTLEEVLNFEYLPE